MQNLVASGVLNLMKDTLTLVVLISLMFYQNWKLACVALIMMPLAAIVAKSLGTGNPHNVIRACLKALKLQHSPKTISFSRNKKISEIVEKRG